MKKKNNSKKEIKNFKFYLITILSLSFILILIILFQFLPKENSTKIENINLQNEPSFGKNSSKVTIVEFTDFECVFCKKMYLENFEKIKEEFEDKIFYVIKDFPISKNSKDIHKISTCIFLKEGNEKYFEIHKYLFQKQNQFTQSTLKARIYMMLDEDEFNNCLNDKNVLKNINEDIKEGTYLNVKSTPTIFINDKKIEGYISYQKLRTIIQNEITN